MTVAGILIAALFCWAIGGTMAADGVRRVRAARAQRFDDEPVPIASARVGAPIHVHGKIASKNVVTVPSTREPAVFVIAMLYEADNLGLGWRLITTEPSGEHGRPGLSRVTVTRARTPVAPRSRARC